MVWNGKTIFPYLILAIFFLPILKIFHSTLKFSSIFYTKVSLDFRPKATHNLYCRIATLSISLQVVAREVKQYGLMHLILYLKHSYNELP